MKQETLDQIKHICFRTACEDHLWIDPLEAYRQIVALIHPPKKPLSEVYLDKQACRMVFEFFAGAESELGDIRHSQDNQFTVLYELKPSYYDDAEPMFEVIIQKNASIFCMKGEMVHTGQNVFELVDLLRSLGYEPNPQP